MTSDLDIYRTAHELIKQFGDAADIEAAMRAAERLAAGDIFCQCHVPGDFVGGMSNDRRERH